MQSIKNKIIISFLAIILCMIGLLVLMTVINSNLINRYKKINSSIVYEQALKDSIWSMVEDCYNGFKTGDYSDYEKELINVQNLEKILDSKTSTNQDTYVAFIGVKNSLEAVVDDVGTAKVNWEENGITGSSNFFQDAEKKFEFVKENTTDLILAETKNIAIVSQDIQKVQTLITFIMGGLSALVIFISIIYSFYFAKKITNPIISLSETAKSITHGNQKLSVSSDLLEKKDEIGSLSNSFNFMVKNLREKIDELETSKQEIEKRSTEITQKAGELERMNKLMIGRELRMAEMKKEIEELKERLVK